MSTSSYKAKTNQEVITGTISFRCRYYKSLPPRRGRGDGRDPGPGQAGASVIFFFSSTAIWQIDGNMTDNFVDNFDFDVDTTCLAGRDTYISYVHMIREIDNGKMILF